MTSTTASHWMFFWRVLESLNIMQNDQNVLTLSIIFMEGIFMIKSTWKWNRQCNTFILKMRMRNANGCEFKRERSKETKSYYPVFGLVLFYSSRKLIHIQFNSIRLIWMRLMGITPHHHINDKTNGKMIHLFN